MTPRSKLLCIAALAAMLAACTGESNTDPTDARRGPLGKADSAGTCDGACGGQSADGCWCDDLCEYYGDCCSDKADECDGAKLCGGIAGLLCDDPDQFCKLEGALGCGFPDQSGTCTDKPEACIEIFAPVCGCDGTTYDNSCFADAAGVNVEHDGACDAPPPPPPPPPPAGDSCEGSCDSQAPDGCWCDSLCDFYGDCCDDKADQCDGDDREPASGACIKNSNDECDTDADCTSGGCGGELCFNPDIGSGISTCECTAPINVGGCGCVQGKCTWWN